MNVSGHAFAEGACDAVASHGVANVTRVSTGPHFVCLIVGYHNGFCFDGSGCVAWGQCEVLCIRYIVPHRSRILSCQI